MKFEPLWAPVIRAKRACMMLPVLESILSEVGRRPATPRAIDSTQGATDGLSCQQRN
jgi:hypothetical protein